MAFMDKVQGLLDKVKTRTADEQPQMMSNRANGGFSGYQPKIVTRKPVEMVPEHPATGFSGMMPGGVDASVMQQFQQVGGQTGQTPVPPMMQGQPMQAPQQARPAQIPMPHARQAGPVQQAQSQLQHTGYQPRHQAPQQPLQQTGWQPRPQAQPAAQQTGWQPVFQPQQQTQPAAQPVWQNAQPLQQAQQPQQPAQPQQDNGLRYFPGAYVTEEGSVYKMVLRVAQITGVASCYRLIEFMQNSEAMIVNAEQIADVMEADRCMDLLFGAAYAMNQNFVRISGKMIYLITPKQVQVVPFDSLLHMSNDDIERR